MSTMHLIRIRCDACGREAGFQTLPDSARKALREVYELGWRRGLDRRSRRKLDVCDLCVKLHRAPEIRRDGTESLADLGLLDIELENDNGTIV